MDRRDDQHDPDSEATYRRVTGPHFRSSFEVYKYTHRGEEPVEPLSVSVTPIHHAGEVVGDVAFRVQALGPTEADVTTIYEGVADPSVTHDLTNGSARYVIRDGCHLRVVTSNPLVSPEDSVVDLEIGGYGGPGVPPK